MSSEERQRQLREQGARPGEAQRQQEAQTGRGELERAEAERAASQRGSPDEQAPMSQDDEDRPVPRR
jgi:hypothetical protein